MKEHKFNMNFEDVSHRIWPRLKKHRREMMGPVLSWWSLFLFRYNHNQAFKDLIDSVIAIGIICLLIVILVVCGFYFANPEPMPTLWNR